MARYNKFGEEIPDPRPMEVPLGHKRPPDIHELIARYVQTETFRQRQQGLGQETFEEANDFELEDDELEDGLTSAEKAFLMAEEFPRGRDEIEAAARAVQEARELKRRGGGCYPPPIRPPANRRKRLRQRELDSTLLDVYCAR